MASIADTDSLSGIEPLDSTATSPLLKASAVSAHPDTISPASQLSSLRASLVQSGTLLKGSDDKPGSHLEASPEFRISNTSTLTQSSLEKHNISHHHSGTSVDAVWQDHRPYPASQIDGKKKVWVKGMSSLPGTPYSGRQHDQQPKRLLATADDKLMYHSQTHRDSSTMQDTSRHHRPTVPANRQLFDSHTAKTTSASKEKHVHSGWKPPPLKTSPEVGHDSVVDKPERLSRGRGNSPDTSLLQSFHSADVRQATTMNWSQQSHREVGGSIVNSHEKSHPSHHRDFPPKQRVTSAEKNFPEIQEMEKVRRSLYHMVHNAMGRSQLERDSLESKESIGELLAAAANHSGAERDFPRESFDSAGTESLLGPQAYQDVSPLAMDSGLGLSSLRNLSNMHVPATRVSSRDGTLFAENQMLKDSLEKERYRRKHCEKQIGDVQAKLLESQQQLAVAVSTDRKKDAMIEQLDKTLARIVDGWRKQEQDKDETLERLANEKEEMAEEMDKLRKALEDHQMELDQAKEKLSSELQQALHLQRDTVSQLVSLQEDYSKVKDQLVSERKLTTQAQHQRDSAIEERHRLDKQIKQVQHMLAEERQQSQTMRKDFQEKIEHLEKDHRQLLEKQKAKVAEESKTSELLSARQQKVDKLKADLDNATKDKVKQHRELYCPYIDILRVTGGGWDGLKEGSRLDGQEEFREFRDILPSLDDTKTTNSMAAYPSEDETVSELESGPINPQDGSNILLERLAEHGHRQMALQHYIQMLLQQPPRAAMEEPATSGMALSKETVKIDNHKQGMTTWQEQAPQSHKRGQTSTRNPNTNPRTNQLTHPQGNTQQVQRSKPSSAGGSAGPRQTSDKQGSSAKTKGPTSSQPQNRTVRPAQRAAPATKPTRPVTASSTTGHKRVVRKGVVRN